MIALEELRDVSGTEFARIVHMNIKDARALLRSGVVPTAFVTPGGQLRVSLHGIAQWQQSRGMRGK